MQGKQCLTVSTGNGVRLQYQSSEHTLGSADGDSEAAFPGRLLEEGLTSAL